jgi:hypothetical protein
LRALREKGRRSLWNCLLSKSKEKEIIVYKALQKA